MTPKVYRKIRKALKKIFYVANILFVTVIVLLSIKNGRAYFETIMTGLVVLYGLHFVGAFLFKTTMYTSGYVASPEDSHWSRLVLFLVAVVLVIFSAKFLIDKY